MISARWEGNYFKLAELNTIIVGHPLLPQSGSHLCSSKSWRGDSAKWNIFASLCWERLLENGTLLYTCDQAQPCFVPSGSGTHCPNQTACLLYAQCWGALLPGCCWVPPVFSLFWARNLYHPSQLYLSICAMQVEHHVSLQFLLDLWCLPLIKSEPHCSPPIWGTQCPMNVS